MSEYIRKLDMLNVIDQLSAQCEIDTTFWNLLTVTLTMLPPADVVERKKGEWIGEADGYADGEFVYDTWYCSCCDFVVEDDEKPAWNYCPNCGARTDCGA